MMWPEEEDTDVRELPLRPPAAVVIEDLPRDPDSGEPVAVPRRRTLTRPYELRGGPVVFNICGDRHE